MYSTSASSTQAAAILAAVSKRAALQAYTEGAVTQLAGGDRFQTAVEISRSRFDPSPDDLSVFIATGQDFPDALAAVPPAAVHGGPILLVTRDTLPASAREELARLRPTNLCVLGGAVAVSDGVLGELGRYAPSVMRVAGSGRYETAVRAGALVGAQAPPATVFIATGENYPDALAGGAVAGALPGPILLVGRDTAPSSVLAEIEELRPDRLVVLGGFGAISAQVEAQLRARADG